MAQIQALDTLGQGNVIGRIIAFLYGIRGPLFFVSFLYAVSSENGVRVPFANDSCCLVLLMCGAPH